MSWAVLIDNDGRRQLPNPMGASHGKLTLPTRIATVTFF